MKTLLLSLGIILSILSNATNYTSVTNGNWSSPLTWGSTTSIPLPGDQVTIEHTVTLDDQYTNEGYWSCDGEDASITISENGILQAGENVLGIAILNGGTITNNGQYIFPQLGNYEGSFINNGTATLNQLIYNQDNIQNAGDILDVDSLKTTGYFFNENGARLYVDSIYVEGQFTNLGHIYNHEITNNGTFENPGTIEFRRFTNIGDFFHSGSLIGDLDATNIGFMDLASNSTFDLQRSFANVDSTNHEALLIVNGTFNIGDSFFNADTIKGTDGHIYMQDSSLNAGWFKESFYFCDATPPSSSPFIDYNTGIIESSVRYCTSENVNLISKNHISFYPNPANTVLYIDGANYIKLIDISGKIVLSKNISNNNSIDIRNLKSGIYFISLENENKTVVRKLIIE